PASASRRKSFGNTEVVCAAPPGAPGPAAASRSAASFARRSAMSLFSSAPSCAVPLSLAWLVSFPRLASSAPPGPVVPSLSLLLVMYYPSHARLERCLQELVQIAVQHLVGVAPFDVGAQVLDPRLIEDVGADLIAPAHVRLGILQYLSCGIALVDFELVE